MTKGNDTKSRTDIDNEDIKLIIESLKDITSYIKLSINDTGVFYKLFTSISLLLPKLLSRLDLITPYPKLDNFFTGLTIAGFILLIINFWRIPEYLIAESSLACLKLFNAGDRFWKYCNKNWLIGFLTSFLRLPSFVFATILYHTMLLMEKIKSLPAIIKSIPSRIKSLVTRTKEQPQHNNLKNRSKILGKQNEISNGLLGILKNRTMNIGKALIRPFTILKNLVTGKSKIIDNKGNGTTKGFASGGKEQGLGQGRKPRSLGIKENEEKTKTKEHQTEKENPRQKQENNFPDKKQPERTTAENDRQNINNRARDYKEREERQTENERKLDVTKETVKERAHEPPEVPTIKKQPETFAKNPILEAFRQKEQQPLTREQQDKIISGLPENVIHKVEEKYSIDINGDDYIGNPKNGVRASDLEQQKPVDKPVEKSGEETSIEDMEDFFNITKNSDDANENAIKKENIIKQITVEAARQELIKSPKVGKISQSQGLSNFH